MRDRMAKKPGGVTAEDEWILHLNDCRGCSALGTRCAVGRKLHGSAEYISVDRAMGDIRKENVLSNPACSFCPKRRREVAKMFSAPGVMICNECVALCVQIQDDEKAEVEALSKAAETKTACQASRGDGECNWHHCPQNRDKEPRASGRSCPLWGASGEES